MKIIIIGAGASGLMAANELTKQGAQVVILEALDRLGGRIHTLTPPGFTNHIEAGAEFIHGSLPLTLKLLRRAKLGVAAVKGEMLQRKGGQLRHDFGESTHWTTFFDLASQVRVDQTVAEFINTHFQRPKHEKFRNEIRSMAQGLDLADINELSLFSIREEWKEQDEEFRPIGGYGPLLEFLLNETVQNGGEIHLGETVHTIAWSPGSVTVQTESAVFEANAVILTLPVATYTRKDITFYPGIDQTLDHFKAIGFGSVIKVVMEFQSAFWEKSHPEMGFLFGENGYTFWTQAGLNRPVLTGWLGNNYARLYDDLEEEVLVTTSIQEFAKAFGTGFEETKTQLRAAKVYKYTENTNTGGGYSWLKPESKKAISILNKGIDNTLWFAGEALYPKTGGATVEAALQSGKQTAKFIVDSL